ncbi:glycosyltransferase [Polaribacter sp. KT 15]|uniref:glycosyltransferase family 2 protein n=1 Tax=Polaribacter sp. KT 15 TaxID=1896175 RepID=UPI00090A182E|nr:glycosyltransferase [Polaribacter sp. KT 15]SHM79019.1 Glycosyltransferase, GT2 family [Polaribacter sp. KT 15]
MLSVLIPTYNYNAFLLVKNIQKQLVLEKIPFEIICFDDGSNSSFNVNNEAINTLSNATFIAFKKNVGRSAIRNLLAEKATFNWLLFLDADVLPVSANFIKNYIKYFNSDKIVFCGGIEYQDSSENQKYLRYKYGKKNEEISLNKRIKNPSKYFFTSNFLIQKAVFSIIKFEEKLVDYGREDLLFSMDLIKEGYKIEQIANEVYHLGIDDNALFIKKTKKAMKNLIFLEKSNLIDADSLQLLKLINKISKFKLLKAVAFLQPVFENLAKNKSSVFFLNCMKVSCLCKLKLKHE